MKDIGKNKEKINKKAKDEYFYCEVINYNV